MKEMLSTNKSLAPAHYKIHHKHILLMQVRRNNFGAVLLFGPLYVIHQSILNVYFIQ